MPISNPKFHFLFFCFSAGRVTFSASAMTLRGTDESPRPLHRPPPRWPADLERTATLTGDLPRGVSSRPLAPPPSVTSRSPGAETGRRSSAGLLGWLWTAAPRVGPSMVEPSQGKQLDSGGMRPLSEVVAGDTVG